MLVSQINEISVWLDQQEDEGLDVSLLRNMCVYNYLFPITGIWFSIYKYLGNER